MELPTAQQLQKDIDELNIQMSDPAVMKQRETIQELAHSLSSKKELFDIVEKLERIEKDLDQASSLLEESDEDMKALAQEEYDQLVKEKEEAIRAVENLLIPKDPLDTRNVILEIRAGAGGDEASLFAGELLRSYARYAENTGWRFAILHESANEFGGYKEVVAEVSGKNVFGTLKYERGVHRVQRIPQTEKMGRVHTSTVTVAVMPQAQDVDIVIRPEDLRIDTYRASGAGGQHVNKTSSAVRITHMPTNTVVACQQERSQHKNKEKAMSFLRSKLLEIQEQEKQAKEADMRRMQIGTGDRSEKIRTYNFPQDRITDHRIKKSWSNIESVMDGKWDDIFASLADTDRAQRTKLLSL